MNIEMREISADNFVDAIHLEVRPEQSRFVASNAASIAQSKFHTFLNCCGLFAGDTMVGFCAFGEHPENGTVWIVRYMIGAAYQGKGYGKKGLAVLLRHLWQKYACSAIFLDVAPENEAAVRFYEGAGFRDTGDIQGHSRIYRLDLPSAGV